MGKIIFSYTDKEFLQSQREASKIELDVPDDMDIKEYKVMCVRLASAMGYHEKSIKRAFGDLIYGDDDPQTLKDLIDELNIKTYDSKTSE
mgnify:FL=1|jgi:hypothetical protein|tara:strand:+ start:74 stop:343 length:270 start_codon:yes stop_codon:yes gene_type:complete